MLTVRPLYRFKRFMHTSFWSPINKVLSPNWGEKFFQSIITIVTLFIYSVLSSCICIQTPTIIESWWMPRSIHTRFWIHSEIKCPKLAILGKFFQNIENCAFCLVHHCSKFKLTSLKTSLVRTFCKLACIHIK